MKWKGIKRRLRGSSSSSGNHIRDDVTLSLTAVNVEVEDDDSVENKNTGEYKNASYCQMLRYAELTDYLLLLFGLLFSVLDGICAPFGSMIFKGISDVLMSGQAAYLSGNFNFDEFAREIMYYCFLYFLQGLNMFILTILAMGCFSTLSERVAHQIKKHYFEAVLMQDQQWFDDHNVGSLTQIITSGIDKIRHGTSDKLVLVIKSTANVISGVVFAFYLSPELTIVMLVMSPFLVSSMYLSNKMLAVQTRKEMAAYSECGAVAEEVLYAIKTVISFNGQLFEIKRYSQSLERAKTVGFRKALIVSACLAVYCAINFFSMGVGFYYGTRLVFDHKISPGVVFGVFWCIFIGCLRFGMAVPQFATLIKAKAAAGEIFAIIDTQPTIDRSAGLTPKAVEGRLEFKNVEFSYPKRRNVKVLKGVSFSVEAGQNVALVGHSGCGKSTMIGLLMRYYQQERGSITVDGVPVQELNVEWLRSNIGIVSQEPVLFQNTVLENLQMGQSTASRGDVEEACTIANAHEFIMKLQDGYDTRIGDGGIKLSGGQKQRIAIARTLLKKPKILLLDEATSALDTESERIVQEALDKASQNRTTVTVAHRLSTVKNADKIIVFDQGAIIESGTHEELFNDVNSHYRQLVLAQQVAGLEESEETDVPSSPKVATSRSRKVSKTDSVRTHESETEEEAEVNEMEELLKKEGVAAATPWEILSYAKNERKLFVTGLFFALIRGCSWPVFAVLYGMFFNLMADPTHSTAERSLYVATIGFGVLGVVSGFATWLSGYITGLVGEMLNVRLRMDVYKNLMRQDCSYFDDLKHSVGKLTARLATDSNNVQAAMDQRLADVLQGLTSFFAGLGVALYFGVQLAPVCLVASGVFIFIQYRISKSVKRRALQDTRIEEDEATMSSEAISNVKTIQSLTQERRICDKFFKVSEAPYKRAIARGWLMSVTLALGAAFVSLNFSVSYMVGLLTIKLGYCTPFTVFQVIESLNVATMMVMATVSYFPEYTRAKLSAGLIFHMLKQHPEIDNLSVEGTKPEIKGNVELKNVVFSYPNGRHVSTLDDISLKAQFGQTVALVGHSGCGKSTVIQLMERFYDVLGGSVKVDGTDVRGINIRHLRDSIALVGQEPTLFNLTIQDNISYGLENVSFQAIREAAKLANIDKFVDSLPQGYETMVGGRGSQLSGGQKQRIAIARAMIRKPKILLLDEATAALDSESEKLVQEALDKAKSGRTCIVVAHRLSTIQNSNVIYVLQNGKCVESGDHQKLLEKAGLYSNLVKSQNMS